MTGTPPKIDKPTPPWLPKHWAWFVGILGIFGIVGCGLSMLLMFPLAMATAGCHDGSTDMVCKLSGRGQNILVMIPWMCTCAGIITAVVTAALAARRRRTPLIGVPVGIVVAFAMIPIGKAIALHV